MHQNIIKKMKRFNQFINEMKVVLKKNILPPLSGVIFGTEIEDLEKKREEKKKIDKEIKLIRDVVFKKIEPYFIYYLNYYYDLVGDTYEFHELEKLKGELFDKVIKDFQNPENILISCDFKSTEVQRKFIMNNNINIFEVEEHSTIIDDLEVGIFDKEMIEWCFEQFPQHAKKLLEVLQDYCSVKQIKDLKIKYKDILTTADFGLF